jgi:phosphoribosylanthranilate isomerase
MDLKLKVCGLKEPSNILEVSNVQPDYMGFIFFKGSKRYVAELSPLDLANVPVSVKKTGVFVNEELEEVLRIAKDFNLNAIQLHGFETALYCKELKASGLEVIKAFGIGPYFDFSNLEDYAPVVDYFLFDTQTPDHGGSGKTFDWSLLKDYQLDVPYFLSGGLDLDSIDAIKSINDSRLYAVDVNSKFEQSAGVKDLNKLINFKQLLF